MRGKPRRTLTHPPPREPPANSHYGGGGDFASCPRERPRPPNKEVKQGKSEGSVGTTDQGKGKGNAEGMIGQGGRGKTQGGERPMGTTACGGRGSKGRAVNGDRPIGAARCRREQYTRGDMPTPPPPTMVILRSALPQFVFAVLSLFFFSISHISQSALFK